MRSLFQDDVVWQKFEKELLSWEGTPYRHLQRTKGRGADCTLMIAQILFDMKMLKKIEHEYYSSNWFYHVEDEFVLNSFEHHFNNHLVGGIKVVGISKEEQLMRGDIPTFSFVKSGRVHHCGIVLDEFDGRCQIMMHSVLHRGVSKFPLGRTMLRKRQGGFRFVVEK